MLKIGDFSRVAHVTVKTLRLYGEKGLLQPTWVDRFSGYRYYSLNQLPRLNRILALKEMGFSLEQIAGMLARPLEVDELRSILRQKRAELEGNLIHQQARLNQLEAHLEQIDQSGRPAGYEVTVKAISEEVVLSRSEQVDFQYHLQDRIRALRKTLNDELALRQFHPTGTWMVIVRESEYTDRNIPLEVAVEVDLPLTGLRKSVRRLVQILPAVPQMACLVHSGARDELSQAYAALFGWIEANGYSQTGAIREICHDDPSGSEHDCNLLELHMPVKKLNPPDLLSKHTRKEKGMEPKLIDKPAFMVVGMKYVGKNENNEIGQMWGQFMARVAEVVKQPFEASYGVCTMVEGLAEGAFEYIAGIEAAHLENLPTWAVVKMIPAYTYAVFEHRGSHATLMDTYHNIYHTWLPQMGLEPAAQVDMEVYTREFKNFAPDSIMYIYVPVRKQ